MINKKIWLVIVAVLLLQGCGIKFWYNRLDWVAGWYIDDFVELTDEQEDRLERFLELKTEWHRANELPKYVAWLNEVERDLQSLPVGDVYDKHQTVISGFYRSIIEELKFELADQMASLSDAQIDAFFKQLEDDEKEWLGKWRERSPEEKLERRVEDIEDGVKEWVGRINKSQKQLIKEWASRIQSTTEERILYRQAWRSTMREYLTDRQSEAGRMVLANFLENPYDLQSVKLKEIQRHNRLLTKEYLVQLWDTLSAKQKRRLFRKINDYREDFSDLIDD